MAERIESKLPSGMNKGLMTSLLITLSILALTAIASATDVDSCADLEAMSGAGTYTLTADVDCSGHGNFTTVGTSGSPFTGTFDGNGYTITGLYINTTASYIGLFGYTNGATITNARLVDVNITGYDYVGGLIGHSTSSTVSNCSVTGDVNGTNVGVGGLVGQFTGTSVSSSYSTADVDCIQDCGGLIGSLESGSVSDSYATGNVTHGNQMGGLIGRVQAKNITNCYATGNVSGGHLVGGLIGSFGWGPGGDPIVVNSYSTGYITCPGARGGLIGGISEGTISDSYWLNQTDDADNCYSSGDTNCTVKTNESWFYDVDNAPMDAWDFAAVWDDSYDGASYPDLKWQVFRGDYGPSITDGLVAYWPLDNDTNDYWYGHDGAAVGAANTTSGRYNGAYTFDGINDYINVTHSGALTPTDAITVSAWIKANTWTATAHEGVIVSKDDWDSGVQGYDLRVGDGGRLGFVLANGTDWTTGALTGQVMSTGKWYNIAGVFNGTDTHTYINGVLEGSETFSSRTIAPSSYPLNMGRNPFVPGRVFNGTIDEVMIFDRALSVEELLQLYYDVDCYASDPMGSLVCDNLTVDYDEGAYFNATAQFSDCSVTGQDLIVGPGGDVIYDGCMVSFDKVTVQAGGSFMTQNRP